MNPIAEAAERLAAEVGDAPPPVYMAGLNREAWLEALLEKLRPLFSEAGYPLPEQVHVSVGWPSKMGRARKNRRIGECWDATTSDDGAPHIFISPAIDTQATVMGVLAHEAVHAAVGTACGHKGPFLGCMKAIGLEGKPTEALPNEGLAAHLADLASTLGDYPHPTLRPHDNAQNKPQTTRMLKLSCARDHEPYLLRASRQTLDRGIPLCGVCRTEMTAEGLASPDAPDDEEDSE